MAIIISSVSSPIGASQDEIFARAMKKAGIKNAEKCRLHKTSLDARKRSEIHYVHCVYVQLSDSKLEQKLAEKYDFVSLVSSADVRPVISDKKVQGRVVIAGFGPAGMFAGLILAENGYRPLILERGQCIDQRVGTVETFMNGGELNERSNIQFGEGGAGTFSDGKLTTRIKDPLCRYVLEAFVRFGAPEEILTKAKAHIGTDKLRTVVKAIRERIIELGGEILFDTKLYDIAADNGIVSKVCYEGGETEVSSLVLAIGHSARDTFEMLCSKSIFMEPKPFSIGARIEHKQADVDRSLYGDRAGDPLLPKGEYQLSKRDKNGRGVYTFCMCPGGYVVPAASESGGVVTNGMSEFARDGENANSAVVVGVTPDDYGKGILDGVDLARSVEQRAYTLTGGYKAAGTTVGGFLRGRPDIDTDLSPTYSIGLVPIEFRDLFPKFVTDMFELGINDFSHKMKCFGNMKAVLSGPETRTSSPVRITRTQELHSLSLSNLYPCGEGAGYAGGIMSAAVDGIKCALKIMENQAP
ncbi:MAG: NAD(P)/FAD-dependent oxidoreductase [Ruminococcus sp.]|nr:NAD(P)/FAD-dependent oxidoreductase [Ruminococcus sp.]